MISLTKPTGTSVNTSRMTLPSVNLLPPEIAQSRRFRRIQVGLGASVVAALGVVALLVAGATGSVSKGHNEVSTAAADQVKLQGQSAQYSEVTATYKRAADAQALLVTAMGEEVRYSHFLTDLALSVPDNVWVKNISFSQAAAAAGSPAAAALGANGIGTVTLTGVAYKHEDVSAWLDALALQKGYANPLFQTSTEALLGTKPVVNWAITVTLSTDALSRRYQKTGS